MVRRLPLPRPGRARWTPLTPALGRMYTELIGVMDFFTCIFLLLSWLYLRRKEETAAKLNDFNTATASDYTVMVRGVCVAGAATIAWAHPCMYGRAATRCYCATGAV